MNHAIDSRTPVSHGKRDLDDLATELAASLLVVERRRQAEQEYSIEHDDLHNRGELAAAAASYALSAAVAQANAGHVATPGFWPWHRNSFKPRGAREDLVRAGALILAELERLARVEASAARRTAGGEGGHG